MRQREMSGDKAPACMIDGQVHESDKGEKL